MKGEYVTLKQVLESSLNTIKIEAINTVLDLIGENNLYLNPGSVSIPKEESAHSYMTLENGVFTWKTLDGEAYQTYAMK